METQNQKTTATALLLGSFLMFITMILHPAGGGGFEGLLRNAQFAIIAHALAILSLPVSALGFFGLTLILDKAALLSRMAFLFMLFGLIAAMLAAAINGLAQPIFALGYKEASPEVIDSIRPIFRYNMALNHAFDYILIGAMFLSTLLWSWAILKTQALPKSLGYFGFLLVLVGGIAIASGFYFLDLYGFRIFVFGWLAWIIGVGVSVSRKKDKDLTIN